MSLVSLTLGRSVNGPHFQSVGLSTAPSTNSRQACSGISGWTPRSSTGQVSTRRWPGGRRSLGAAVLPVSSRPSAAHFCLLSISLSLSLPDRVTSSSDMNASDAAARVLPIWGAELAFEDLSRVLARQAGAELDDLRHLVARNVLAEERPHRGRVDRGTRHRLDMGADLLAELLVGDAEHRAVAHARHLDQHRFDLRRVDVDAARDDHVALAVAQEDVAVGVLVADIAHRHEVAQRDLAALGVVVVVGEFREMGPAQVDLADLTLLHV